MKKIIVLFFITALCLIITPEALGQEKIARPTIRVSPVILNISLSPGKTYEYKIQVENLLNQPLPVHTLFDDFIDQNEEGGYVFKTNQKKNPLLQWTSFDIEDLILNPYEKKIITLKIQIPKTVPVGGYYGLAFLEPVSQQRVPGASVVTARVGILLLANVGIFDSKGEKGKIIDFSFGKNVYEGDDPKQLLLRVQNTSLGHYTGKPILTTRPLFGSYLTQELEEKIVFPGKIRRWTEFYKAELFPGYYQHEVKVSVGNGETLKATTSFIVFPYKKVALLIPILVIVLLYLKRKRLIAAGKAFFESR